ncbi:MAG: hypothetical protein IT428_13010 [Planctomycetaceae bacterium]|nr:hypothetical protein [Planctomycetaceae bacterium]
MRCAHSLLTSVAAVALVAALYLTLAATAVAQRRGGGMGGGMMGGGMRGGMMGPPPMMQRGMGGGMMPGGMCQMGQSGSMGMSSMTSSMGTNASGQSLASQLGSQNQASLTAMMRQLQNANSPLPPPPPRINNINPTAMVKNLDKDGDGVLQVDEIPRRLKAKLQQADTNFDGEITLAELESARTASK